MLMIHSAMAAMTGAGVSSEPVGQALFTTNGTTSWVVPEGVKSVCLVAISKGGGSGNDGERWWSGAGGGLAYRNDVPVTPGEVLTVLIQSTVTGEVRINRGTTKLCAAANANRDTLPGQGTVGAVLRKGGPGWFDWQPSGLPGGGAAGYSSDGQSAIGIQGSNGGGGTSPNGGGPGAAANVAPTVSGLPYGGGSGTLNGNSAPGAVGCVRVIWGPGRAFPNTLTEDMS